MRCDLSPHAGRGEIETWVSALYLPAPAKEKGGPRPPPCSTPAPCGLLAHHAEPAAAGTPDINADKQEQPDHVDEVPVPGGELEAEVLLRREMPGIGAAQAHAQEDGADQHMEAVEAGRHEEGRAVDVAGEVEQG